MKKNPVETKEVFIGSFVPDLKDTARIPEIEGSGAGVSKKPSLHGSCCRGYLSTFEKLPHELFDNFEKLPQSFDFVPQ